MKKFIFELMTAGRLIVEEENFEKACTKASFILDQKKYIKEKNNKINNPYAIIK